MKRREGFTLVELLIVVVIIGILVSISIPIFTAQMHKAKVAADWANLRAYYAEIQADYMSTQKQNPKVKVIDVAGSDYDWQSVTFLDGHKVKMKAGYCAVLRRIKDIQLRMIVINHMKNVNWVWGRTMTSQ